ncbi:hypothetical protein M5689_000696 [Euphorbia peplus]|nr:hypothetical protein M5689_000696 [Euphorbia peplus]
MNTASRFVHVVSGREVYSHDACVVENFVTTLSSTLKDEIRSIHHRSQGYEWTTEKLDELRDGLNQLPGRCTEPLSSIYEALSKKFKKKEWLVDFTEHDLEMRVKFESGLAADKLMGW